ncbi:hypothetical protein KY362_04675 [Candidatus Woesearchaeota archaeon]|nr:hypothetical protein [Candidatus Woesearchaeota archaeon]
MVNYLNIFAGSVLFLTASAIFYGMSSILSGFVGAFPVVLQLLVFVGGVFFVFAGIFYLPLYFIMEYDGGAGA